MVLAKRVRGGVGPACIATPMTGSCRSTDCIDPVSAVRQRTKKPSREAMHRSWCQTCSAYWRMAATRLSRAGLLCRLQVASCLGWLKTAKDDMPGRSWISEKQEREARKGDEERKRRSVEASKLQAGVVSAVRPGLGQCMIGDSPRAPRAGRLVGDMGHGLLCRGVAIGGWMGYGLCMLAQLMAVDGNCIRVAMRYHDAGPWRATQQPSIASRQCCEPSHSGPSSREGGASCPCRRGEQWRCFLCPTRLELAGAAAARQLDARALRSTMNADGLFAYAVVPSTRRIRFDARNVPALG